MKSSKRHSEQWHHHGKCHLLCAIRLVPVLKMLCAIRSVQVLKMLCAIRLVQIMHSQTFRRSIFRGNALHELFLCWQTRC